MDFAGDMLVPRRVIVSRIPILHQFFVATKKTVKTSPRTKPTKVSTSKPTVHLVEAATFFFPAEKNIEKLGKNRKNDPRFLEEMLFGWWQLKYVLLSSEIIFGLILLRFVVCFLSGNGIFDLSVRIYIFVFKPRGEKG